MRRFKHLLTASALALATFPSTANAGSILLTGHDVDFHSNQNGFANIALNYLRGAGLPGEIAAASYDILALRSTGVGSFTSPTGFASVTIADPTTFDWGTLGSYDVIEIASHTSCGGCALSTAGSDAINDNAAAIATFVTAGGDLYVNSGAGLGTYYGFLPAGSVATGVPIGGASGFSLTAAGAAIGLSDIPPSMINGFPTHNRFTGFSPVFTVFEVRGEEVITIGTRDVVIVTDVISTTGGPGTAPEPASLLLLGAGLAIVAARRRRAAKQ